MSDDWRTRQLPPISDLGGVTLERLDGWTAWPPDAQRLPTRQSLFFDLHADLSQTDRYMLWMAHTGVFFGGCCEMEER